MGGKMQIDRRISHGARARLSFGELTTAELFFLWVLRERFDTGPGSMQLLGAFRRVFGLAAVEGALAAFECMFTILLQHLTREARVLSPECVQVSRDELLLLHAFAALQAERTPHVQSIARTLVGPVWACALCQWAREFGSYMSARELVLPLRGLATLVSSPTQLH
jgi:hypothetical protein